MMMEKTIVVIDEDSDQRERILSSLAAMGWKTHDAIDGETGLALIEKHRPSVVVCDMRIPRNNGLQICARLRQNSNLSSIYIIITSGSRFEGDYQSAIEAGANAYLQKPYTYETLEAAFPSETDLKEAPDDSTEAEVASSVLKVRFWGVRGSIPTPGPSTIRYGGNTPCIEVRTSHRVIILDAGTGIRLLGEELDREFGNEPIDAHLFITHTHWDHIQGLPFFRPAYQKQNRLKIYGYAGSVEGMRKTVLEQMKSAYFPINIDQLSDISFLDLEDMEFTVGRCHIQTTFTNHPGICIAYRLNHPVGSIVYLCDHEVHERQCSSSPGFSAERLEFARKEDEKIRSFAQNADMMIADAPYTSKEYESRVGWGHSRVDDVVDLAGQAGVKRLFLFHHDPLHNDEKIDEMVVEARSFAKSKGYSLEVDAAKEGMQYELPTPETR